MHENKDLQHRIGLGLAVAWVLAHLWIASPLPYLLADALGRWVVITDMQQRGLMLSFALCLAFLLFEPRRLKLPPAANRALAALGAVAGSIVMWNYGHIADNPLDPGGFSLAVAFLGMVLLLLACLRVFGWFGWVLVGLLAAAHLIPLALDLPYPRRLSGAEALLTLHWFTTESVFGIPLGITVSVGIFLVMLGVGYDVLGCGRPLASGILRPLPPDAPTADLASYSRIARSLWALVALHFLFGGSALAFDVGERLTFESIGRPVLLGFVVYIVFLAVAWSSQATNNAQRRKRLLGIGAGGMLLGFVPILSVVLSLAHTIFESVFSGLSIRQPGLAGSLVAPALFLGASLLLIVVAKRQGRPGQRALWLGVLMLLPLLLFFWAFAVDRLSPGLAAVYADILMLVVVAGVGTAGGGGEMSSETEPKCFVAPGFLPLCHGTARVMVRVVILAAFSGMLIPLAFVWLSLFVVLSG